MKIRLFTLPNLLTLMNLLCGCLAVVSTLCLQDLQTAFWLMVASAVFDFLDGFAARLTGQASAIGVQLDSLADVVSFGLSPAAIAFVLYYQMGGTDAWGYAAFLVALFSALRLARFNIDPGQQAGFIGLPVPAGALFFGGAGWLFATGSLVLPPWSILVAVVVVSYLLISPLSMFALKFKGFGIPGNELRYAFLLASLLGLILYGVAAVPAIIAVYVLIALIRAACCRRCRVRQDVSGTEYV